MPSTFFGLNIASSGLRSANAALNTTANNISNVNTKGYSRQEVKQEAANCLRVFDRYGCAGAGVDTLAIERIRDEFYDNKYRNNKSLLGNEEQKNYYNKLLEQYLDDDGISGFNTLFTKIKTAVQDIKNNGTSDSKTVFMSQVKNLTEYFNNAYEKMTQTQSDVNTEVKICTDRINSIAQEIASVNKQINIIEMTGATANELRDKRDLFIDNLSEIVKVETNESPIIDESNEKRYTGATRYQVWIAGNVPLVDTYEYKQMICVERKSNEKVNENDVDGLYDIKIAGSNYKEGDEIKELADFDTNSKGIGGKLQGLFAVRDGNNGQIFKGKSISVAGSPVEVKVKCENENFNDMTKNTLPESGKIKIGGKEYIYDSFEFDGTNTFTFKMNENISSIPENKSMAQVGFANSYQGIPYYMQQMNEWIRNFSSNVNEIFETGFSSGNSKGQFLLTGSLKESDTQFTFEDLTMQNKGYSKLNAKNFTVNSNLLKNSDNLATKTDITEGESQFENLNKLLNMFDEKKIFKGANSGEFLSKVLSDIALNTSNSGTLEKTYNTLSNTIENQRLSQSGVDEDEEASNLVKYQNTYALNSKMIQTFSEIYDRLILQTGI